MMHPQTRALLERIAELGVAPTHTLSVDEARRAYRERGAITQPAPPPVAAVHELNAVTDAGPVALRLYRPIGSDADSALPVLVYFHGGGWVIGDLQTHDTLCRELANGAGSAVVSVDYRRGPEHPFPAAVDDCIGATRWVRAHAEALHLDAARLAVGGDSAGGNLAAVVAIAARDAGHEPIALQLLIYPAVDQHRRSASHTENAQGYLLTADTMDYFIGHYIIDRAHYDDWRASPLAHPDLSRLPPALVLTAGFDPLRDEGAAYARRLTGAGGQASLVHFPRQIHGFITMGRAIDEAHTAVALCAAAWRRAIAATR